METDAAGADVCLPGFPVEEHLPLLSLAQDGLRHVWGQGEHVCSGIIWTYCTAGSVSPDGVLAQQGWAGLGVAQDLSIVARALRTLVQLPRLSLHKVLPAGRVAHRGVRRRLGGIVHIIRTGGAALASSDDGLFAAGSGTRDERTHLLPTMTVTLATAVVPALTVLVPLPVHRQTRVGRDGEGRRQERSLFALADITALAVLHVAEGAVFLAHELRTLIAPAHLAAMLVDLVAVGAPLVTIFHGLALLGGRLALTGLAALAVDLEPIWTVKVAVVQASMTQFFFCEALTDRTAEDV